MNKEKEKEAESIEARFNRDHDVLSAVNAAMVYGLMIWSLSDGRAWKYISLLLPLSFGILVSQKIPTQKQRLIFYSLSVLFPACWALGSLWQKPFTAASAGWSSFVFALIAYVLFTVVMQKKWPQRDPFLRFFAASLVAVIASTLAGRT